MGLIELIVLVLVAAAACGIGFCLYRSATRPAGDVPVAPDDLQPVDDPSEPAPPDRSPVELL